MLFVDATDENNSKKKTRQKTTVPHEGPGDPRVGGDFDERRAVLGIRGEHFHQQFPQPLVRCTIQGLLHGWCAKVSSPKRIMLLSEDNTNQESMPSVIAQFDIGC